MKKINTITKRASKPITWSFYVLIFFEMLYMSTPFAVYFYSVYGMPLQKLNSSTATAWLVQHLLPHFSKTESLFINIILYISWPLMVVGLVGFGIAFGQIYWAKFRNKDAVLGGLYRFVRHPQYAALAIFGLGMALFWSRMIVLICFVSMLFVYYFLAKHEERECLQKYGESYRKYMDRTGRFLPKFNRQINESPQVNLPYRGSGRIPAVLILYLVAVGCSVGLGFWLRSYSISQIASFSEADVAVVSTYPMNNEKMRGIYAMAQAETTPSHTKQIVYIVPLDWVIPELAMEAEPDHSQHGFNPATHGNPMDIDPHRFKVLFSKAVVDADVPGADILRKARAQKPFLLVKVDMRERSILGVERPPKHGKYGDIPVPLF